MPPSAVHGAPGTRLEARGRPERQVQVPRTNTPRLPVRRRPARGARWRSRRDPWPRCQPFQVHWIVGADVVRMNTSRWPGPAMTPRPVLRWQYRREWGAGTGSRACRSPGRRPSPTARDPAEARPPGMDTARGRPTSVSRMTEWVTVSCRPTPIPRHGRRRPQPRWQSGIAARPRRGRPAAARRSCRSLILRSSG